MRYMSLIFERLWAFEDEIAYNQPLKIPLLTKLVRTWERDCGGQFGRYKLADRQH
jgi:hypothetical protein